MIVDMRNSKKEQLFLSVLEHYPTIDSLATLCCADEVRSLWDGIRSRNTVDEYGFSRADKQWLKTTRLLVMHWVEMYVDW